MPDTTLPPDEAAAPEPDAVDQAAPEALPDVASDAAPEAAAEAVAAPATSVPDLSPAACGARLGELFPALFGKHRPLPLKLRIQADIQQRAPGIFSKKSLSGFLHRHTTSTAYLIALGQSQQRFDLDGAPAGELAEEHRAAAQTELARRREVHEARRAAEQAALQRERAAENDARRERATLLRAFETTTLTRANFCALKGIAEAELDAVLATARQEREQRPPMADREQRPERQRPHDAHRPRGDERGRRPRRPAPAASGPR